MNKNAHENRHLHFQEIATKLRSCNELAKMVDVPMDIGMVLATGRTQLLAAVQPRALTVEECGKLYELVAVLIETNFALQEHSRMLALMAQNLSTQLKGINKLTGEIDLFANFKHDQMSEDET